MRLSTIDSRDTSSPAPPERSPLEPLSAYGKRLRKSDTDNAKWEGQKRALRLLEKKKTQVPESPDPKLFP